MMMQNSVILISPDELQSLIIDAVNLAIQQQITFPQKIEPQPP
jgi:hypothetical protein